MTVPGFDRRLMPARPDLAAEHLRGQVSAARFTPGIARRVTAPVADLRRDPRADAPLDTQALHGEAVTLYEEHEGWSWVQLESDGYVGYVATGDLGPPAGLDATHRVVANRTFVYPAADMKRPPLAALPLGALVTCDGTEGLFHRLHGGGFVFMRHVVPRDAPAKDFVTVAEGLLLTPYLWGGKSALGIDCSGLVQLAMGLAGRAVPRDSDLQAGLGTAVAAGDTLRRGDLVFWPGHVGIMRNATELLHANAFHMSVETEPLATAAQRIEADAGSKIMVIKRL